MRAGRESVPQAVALMLLSIWVRSSLVCLSIWVADSYDGGAEDVVEIWEWASQYSLRVR